VLILFWQVSILFFFPPLSILVTSLFIHPLYSLITVTFYPWAYYSFSSVPLIFQLFGFALILNSVSWNYFFFCCPHYQTITNIEKLQIIHDF
jgi:hypothetical protein